MCGSVADIQSAAAEIRRGKKEERRTNHSMKIWWSALFHRTTITSWVSNTRRVSNKGQGSSSIVQVEASLQYKPGSNSKWCQLTTVVYVLRHQWHKYTWQNSNGIGNVEYAAGTDGEGGPIRSVLTETNKCRACNSMEQLFQTYFFMLLERKR